jgi:hypothetical protein
MNHLPFARIIACLGVVENAKILRNVRNFEMRSEEGKTRRLSRGFPGSDFKVVLVAKHHEMFERKTCITIGVEININMVLRNNTLLPGYLPSKEARIGHNAGAAVGLAESHTHLERLQKPCLVGRTFIEGARTNRALKCERIALLVNTDGLQRRRWGRW